MRMRTFSIAGRQQGMTIVELMVGLAVSLLLLGAISGVYLTSRQSYRVSDASARYQENMRFLGQALGGDLRLAGHLGCNSLGYNGKAQVVSAIPAASRTSINDYAQGIIGYETALPPELAAAEHAAGDIVKIQYMSPNSWRLSASMATDSDAITFSGDGTILPPGGTLVVSDCFGAETFIPTSISTVAGTVTVTHPKLSRAYSTKSEIAPLVSLTYYIGPVGTTNTLKRISAQGTEVVADGVEDMRVLYGTDTNLDGQTDVYLNADAMTAANWGRVTSVQLCLQFVSSENGLKTERGSYTNCLGQNIVGADLRMRQLYSTTVSRRNAPPV